MDRQRWDKEGQQGVGKGGKENKIDIVGGSEGEMRWREII